MFSIKNRAEEIPESPGLSFSVSYKALHLFFKCIEKSNSAILFNFKAVILFSATFPLFFLDNQLDFSEIHWT